MDELSLRCLESDAQLVLTRLGRREYLARFEGRALRVVRRFSMHRHWESLNSFFQDLARDRDQHAGERFWGALDGEFAVTCRLDGRPQVTFYLEFTDSDGAVPWNASAAIRLSTSALPLLARRAGRFFALDAVA